MNRIYSTYVLILTVSVHCTIFNLMSNLTEPTHIFESVKRIIDKSVHRVPVIFFKNEISKIWWTNLLIQNIKKPTLIVKKHNAFDIQGFYILFPITRKSYKKMFYAKNYDKSKFLLVWNDRSNLTMSMVRSVFEEFWFYQHINVIALIKNRIYTFLPYTENKCNSVGDPVIIDTWDKNNKTFSINYDWFSTKIKVRNLRGCALRTIGNHQPPDNMMYVEKNKWNVTGVGYKMLEIVSQHLNFTPIIVATNVTREYSWYYFFEELKYISEAIYRKEADLAFGWFSYASIEIHNLDVSVELARVSSIDCFGWAVPYRAGARPPNSAYFTYEFEAVTWILIISTFFLMSTIVYCVRKNLTSIFFVYQIFLEQPVTQYQSTSSFKALFMIFSFYSLIISAVYKASFGSFITVSTHGKDFTNIKDILNSSLRICGSPEMLNLINATAMETTAMSRIIERFNILQPCQYEDVMSRLVRQRDIAVLGVKRSLYYHSIREAKRIKVKIPFRFIPGCLLRAHTTHFMFRRGSYLIEPVNVAVNRLFETGVIPYWIVHLGSNKISPVERFKGRTLKLSFLKEPIMLLITGYIFSCVILLLEIIWYKHFDCEQKLISK